MVERVAMLQRVAWRKIPRMCVLYDGVHTPPFPPHRREPHTRKGQPWKKWR